MCDKHQIGPDDRLAWKPNLPSMVSSLNPLDKDKDKEIGIINLG